MRRNKVDEIDVDELYDCLKYNAHQIARGISTVAMKDEVDAYDDAIRRFEIEEYVVKRVFACAYNLIDEVKEKYPKLAE